MGLDINKEGVFSVDALSELGIETNRGTVRTYNKTGYMNNHLCELSQKFCSQPFSEETEILEIGCGIGAVLKTLIDAGGKNITAVDAEEKHLEIVSSLLKKSLFKKPEVNLQLIHDSLPFLEKLKRNSYDVILCAQVLHFLKPDSFEIAAKNLYELLKKDGKLYITIGSPKLKVYEGFSAVYERRLKNGEKYPGYMEDTRLYNPGGVQHNKGSFLFFGSQDLRERIEEFGFFVLESKYIKEADNEEGQTALIGVKRQ